MIGRRLVAMVFLLPCFVLQAAVTRSEVVSRTLQESGEFVERFGPSERAKTPSDARLQLYAETAEECRRLEKMSGQACRVASLTLHVDANAGRAAVLGSVRFVLGTPGDEPSRAPQQDGSRSDGKKGDQH